MTKSTSYGNSIGVLHRLQKLGLISGIAAGTILGVPAFISASDSLLGSTVSVFGEVILGSPLVTDMFKWGVCGGVALGGYGIWRSRIDQFKKLVGLAGVGVALVNLLPMSSAALFSSIVGGIVPAIGFTVWGCINASQIHLLTLKNSDDVLNKLASKVQAQDAVSAASADDNFATAFVKSRFGRNKTAQALSFWVGVAFLGYVIEAGVQILYGRGSALNWAKILSPGGLWAFGWELIAFIAVLLATIASIEYCVTALMRLHDMQEAIRD